MTDYTKLHKPNIYNAALRSGYDSEMAAEIADLLASNEFQDDPNIHDDIDYDIYFNNVKLFIGENPHQMICHHYKVASIDDLPFVGGVSGGLLVRN